MEYYYLLDQLVDEMASIEEFDIPKIYEIMGQLCRLLRVAKGVTTFYSSPMMEKLGKGEAFVCYDSGEPMHLVSSQRIMTPSMSLVVVDVYIAEDETPWSEEEARRINLIQRIMLTFLNRSRLAKEVSRLTFYDDDGYKNTRYFMSQVAQCQELDKKAAVRLNLKHFSILNQQVGRAAGNVLIRNYISSLEETIGDSGFVCRLGGDNFVLLCGAECVDEVVRKLRGIPVTYDKNTDARAMVSSTAGVYVLGRKDVDINEIMTRITSAHEAAKSGGNEEIVFCSPELESEKENVKRIQQLFPLALKNEEFLVYYQPKIDVFGSELAGAEALCRWQHEGRIIPPMEFIPVLERNLDICTLDFYMLDHVCKDIRRWLDEGRKVVRVSVNLSRKHMVDADLFRHILEIIDRNHVPHQYIEIELTETTTDVEFRDLKKVVNGLQQEGIYTSVDDFGIGYSSLNLLREIPWNVLKVDKSFLPDEKGKGINSIMFKHVIAMARELGLECIAEGVETEQQVNILKDNLCDVAQGFFYDRPLPVHDFENRLDMHHYAQAE